MLLIHYGLSRMIRKKFCLLTNHASSSSVGQNISKINVHFLGRLCMLSVVISKINLNKVIVFIVLQFNSSWMIDIRPGDHKWSRGHMLTFTCHWTPMEHTLKREICFLPRINSTQQPQWMSCIPLLPWWRLTANLSCFQLEINLFRSGMFCTLPSVIRLNISSIFAYQIISTLSTDQTKLQPHKAVIFTSHLTRMRLTDPLGVEPNYGTVIVAPTR